MAISNALKAYLADRSAFCYGAQAALVDVGAIAVAAIKLPGNRGDLPDEVWVLDFRRGVAEGAMLKRPGLGDGNRQEYNIFSGTLVVKIGLLRVKNVESQVVGCLTVLDEREAIARAVFLRSAQSFTIGRLKNFAVVDIVENQPPVYGVDKTNDRERDVVELFFGISYERIAANFPAA